MVNKCVDATVMAYNKLEPAKVGIGNGHLSDIAFNRRYFMKDGTVKTNPGVRNPDIIEPTGPIDPDVTVLRISDSNDKLIGVVTNYACHLDVVGGTEYSADYPGEMSRVLKDVYGKDIVSIFLTGACGNINHIDVSGNFLPLDKALTSKKENAHKRHYVKMGKILAGEVIKVLEKVNTFENAELNSASHDLKLAVRQPSLEDVEKAKSIINSIKETPQELAKNDRKKLITLSDAKETIRASIEKKESIDAEVQVFKIDELTITALPGEIFVEFGLDIKKHSGFKYNMINSLANGVNAYIPTKEAVEQGGYETVFYASSRLETEAGYKMVEKAIELISQF